MKNFTIIVSLLLIAFTGNYAMAQTPLATWSTFPSSGWNPTWTPNAVGANVTVSDFTKGAGITAVNNPANSSWGGSGGWAANPAAGSLDGSLYFTIQANPGYKLSLSSIPVFGSRRSNSGPTGATVLYSIDGGVSYTTIAVITTASTGATPTSTPITTLGTFSDLQDLSANVTVIIKLVPTSTTNNWYIIGGFQLSGSVTVDVPLPVSLATFTGSSTQSGVALNWTTAMEKNSSYFELEKSNDAKNFNTLSKIPTENKEHGASYSYNDNQENGTVYYRLKTVDLDGKYTYSEIIKVVTGVKSSQAGIVLKGNPVADQLVFQSTTDLSPSSTYQIVNLSGSTLKMGTLSADNHNYAIAVSELSAGMYVLHIYDAKANYSVKFVKQ